MRCLVVAEREREREKEEATHPFPYPRCDYEWRLIEESLPDAQWHYGKDPEHGWPYPVH